MAFLKNFNIPRILLIAVIIVSLVAFSSYTAPKAQAEAVSLTLTTAFLMLVIGVMATLGVTLTAPTVQAGIDYLQDPFLSFLQGKGYSSISEYLSSVGITAVTQLAIPVFGAVNIVKTVYDVIAEFCTSFFAEKDVVDNGDPVGDVGISGIYSSAQLQWTVNSTGVWYYTSTALSHSYTDGGVYSLSTSSSANQYTQNSICLRIPTDRPTSVSVRVNGVSSAIAFVGTINATSLVNNTLYPNRQYSSFVVSSSWSTHSISYVNGARFLCIGISAMGSNTVLQFRFSINDPTSPAGFVINPSASVLAPPQVATGQTYSIPSSGVQPDDNVEDAIPALVAPLTTSGGLTKTATVAGTAVPAEWAWLYDGLQGINVGVESIKNNTSDDKHGTDFIPSSTTMDFGFWHYVPDWISSVGAGFSMLVGVVTSLPSIMLAPLYGILVLGIVVALFHKLWGS